MDSTEAILFADIAGSTGLYERVGDALAFRLVAACLDSLRRQIVRHGGAVIKTIGDEIMASFDSPAAAIAAANAMQVATSASGMADQALKLRIGVHWGKVVRADGDCFGDTVNVAARLASLATPDQILTSRQTFDQLPPYLQATCRHLYATAVKGRSESIAIFEAMWRFDQEQTMITNQGATAIDVPAVGKLVYRGKIYLLSEDKPELTIGRDPSNAVVVGFPTASRNHAKLFYRRARFVYVDQSSSGSYVSLGNAADMLLRREELALSSSRACIGLGTPTAQCGVDLLLFEVTHLDRA